MPYKLSKEEHKRIHNELHKSLDELVGDFIEHTEKLPSQTTVIELMKWSHKQTENPDEEKEVQENG